MSEIILGLVLGIAAIIILLAVVFAWKLKKNNWQHETDYRAFFWIGIIWTIFGALSMLFFDTGGLTSLFIIGLVFLGVGAANKYKWGKRQKVDPKQQKRMIMVIAIGVLVLVFGVLAFLLFAGSLIKKRRRHKNTGKET